MGNQFKTWMFMALLSLLVLFAGRILAGRQGLLLAFVFVLGINIISYFYSQRIILWTYNARRLEGVDPYGLNKLVTTLSHQIGIPKPEVYIIPSSTPNAFAIGLSPQSSSIVFTEGILQILTKEEISGVVAHELSHIMNRDTFIMMTAATLGSVVMYVAQIFKWLTVFGKNKNDDKNPSGVVGSMMVALLAPFSATLIQLAVSRNREYLADTSATDITGQPHALASALWKIHHYSENMPLPATLSTAHLFIINPLSGNGLTRLFSTHPPVEERIKRLTGKAP